MPKKEYPQAIVNWPAEERPREKLLMKGAESLTNAELLAIFLRVGVNSFVARLRLGPGEVSWNCKG